MNMNAMQATSGVRDIQKMMNDPTMRAKMQERMAQFQGSGADSMQISSMGNMMQQVSSLSAGDQAELRDFAQNMRQDLQSGTFNAKKASEDAPDALKALAEEQGIDLGSVFGEAEMMSGRMQQMARGMGGGQNMMNGFLSMNMPTGGGAEDQLLESLNAIFDDEEN